MDVFTELMKIAKKELNKKINLKSTFKDIGLDSIDVLNLIVKLEEKFNIQIEDEKLLAISNVEDLVKIIENKLDNKK